MKYKSIKYYLLATLSAAILSACSSGSCTSTDNGNLSLKISAPTQYPAGVPVTAYLTMTNTSNVDGNNLVYTVPNTTNYTGVTITIDPNGAGQNCGDIKSSESCTFTALIPAGSHPGSFTVLATPNGNSQSSVKVTNAASLQAANSISVTANLGLVSLPTTNNSFYIIPNQQTILPNSNGTATAYVTVYNNSYTGNFNNLNWYDNNSVKLNSRC